MKIKEGKVEVDEKYLRFCLIHVLYHVYPCRLTFEMENYWVENENDQVKKMNKLGVQCVIDYPYWFTFYD
jgi:hypothetical protein